ncbi:hypothetical protein CC1G_10762 [Coprinopsis cinerea okayama7|uniref:Uncharacterized protein n=1 Tax=Coprinopsis cinerea (strain Okayama-7 / 130 / ATCC MYA-4618 / FGSC 9003) TaxID=240176 RepID=A8P3C4_COPC7|nr:hypothetical protein CC1G_10762 [Coprinopsis cinerea okayama7\|eukprot:XP_001838520.1 hypothetical protein CC1G_10762 [Coprinopsis cinerea okayama7\
MTTEIKRSIWIGEDGTRRPPPPLKISLKNPGLFNWDPERGKKVRPRVFAIPLMEEVIDKFMEKYCPDIEPGLQRSLDFVKEFRPFFPPEIYRLACIIVPLPGRALWEPLGLVIASNLDAEDMARAEDEELIKKCQEILGVTTPPAWYHYQNP